MDGWGLSNVKYVDAEPEATGDGAHSFPGRKPGEGWDGGGPPPKYCTVRQSEDRLHGLEAALFV